MPIESLKKMPAFRHPWIPDQKDGTFYNPIIYADYSDPDVIRHGDDFYLTASSFNCTPGLPILHSKDLVNWTIINHAVKNLPHPRYAEVQHGCGVWAPAIRFHNGKFWIFFPMPDEGIYVTTADDPADRWSEPHLVQEGKGLIDPCPFWDDDGKAYLVHAYAGSRAGIKHILRVRPMASDGSRLLGEGEIVFHDPERHPTLEGPKFLKKDGRYYILAPAGGVQTGWQVVLRSRNIFGSYEDKIVLEQGNTSINGPHQGALIDLPNGEWWFLHFQDAGAYGRIVHLQPVNWKDGWPFMGRDLDGNGIGEPVLHCQKPAIGHGSSVAIPQTSDEFDSPTLGLQWQWHANFSEKWFSLPARKNRLRLFSVPMPAKAANFWPVPNLLLQKLPALKFTATTELDFSRLAVGGKAGLIVMGMDYSYLAVERTAANFRLIKATCKEASKGDAEVVEAETKWAGDSIFLRVEVDEGALCHFSFSRDGEKFSAMGKNFTAREGIWIGAKVGLFCLSTDAEKKSGHADFARFRFS
ncbi:MAG: glycoside hydrolase 43 family protein [Verrucomicrobiota bacterium]|jgi:beta-xylosidase